MGVTLVKKNSFRLIRRNFIGESMHGLCTMPVAVTDVFTTIWSMKTDVWALLTSPITCTPVYGNRPNNVTKALMRCCHATKKFKGRREAVFIVSCIVMVDTERESQRNFYLVSCLYINFFLKKSLIHTYKSVYCKINVLLNTDYMSDLIGAGKSLHSVNDSYVKSRERVSIQKHITHF